MKRDDLVRVTRAIEPGKELKMKVIHAALRPRKFRLEKPGRMLSALGAAALLCACVVGGAFLLKDWMSPGATGGPAAAGQPTATDQQPDGTDPQQATETPVQQASSTPLETTGSVAKLSDVIKLTEKDGKCYAEDKLLVIAACEPSFALDAAWAQKAVNGELTREEILAEFAKADERAANYVPPFKKNTLPDGIISAQQALPIARDAYKTYFGVTAGDCDIIDNFTYSQSVLLGSDTPVPPGSYRGKESLAISLFKLESGPKSPDQHPSILWHFEYYQPGDTSGRGIQISIDAVTGQVRGGSLDGMSPKKIGYPKAELNKRAEIAKAYVTERGLLGGAAIAKVENLKLDTDVAVTLSDGSVITLTMDKDRNVVGFDIKRGKNNTPPASPTPSAAFALPNGAIPPEQALTLAVQAIRDLYGVDVSDYTAIQSPTRDMSAQSEDDSSTEQLLDSGEPVDMKEYKNTDRKYVEFWLLDYSKEPASSSSGAKYRWIFYFINGAQGMSIGLDGSTGYVTAAGGPESEKPTNVNVTGAELAKQKNIAREFVEGLKATNGASVTKVEGRPGGAEYPDFYVYLSDGRYVRVILDDADKVMSFVFLVQQTPDPHGTPGPN